jgi:protein SCO1
MNDAHQCERKQTRFRRLWFWPAALGVLVVLICAAAVLATVGNHRPQSVSMPQLLDSVGFDSKPNARIPLDVQLRDESGREVPVSELFKDQPIILVFVYYRCPMLCNLTMEGLVRGLSRVPLDAGQDFSVVMVSIDPRETQAQAAAAKQKSIDRYARPGAEDGWRFLTGDEQQVSRLADAVGFRYRYDPATDQYAHAAGVTILTPEGVVSRYLYGVDFPPRDLRLALIDASRGGVGSTTDRVLLLCFHYDPTTGKYGLAVIRLLQLGGLTTAIGMGLAIGISLLRERRRQIGAIPVMSASANCE